MSRADLDRRADLGRPIRLTQINTASPFSHLIAVDALDQFCGRRWPFRAETTRSRKSMLYGLPIPTSRLVAKMELAFAPLENPLRLAFFGECALDVEPQQVIPG